MKLDLIGHEDRYAVEQLQMSLFDLAEEGAATSSLHRGKTWLTAVKVITRNGLTTRAFRRLKAGEETVRLRRRILQQSYYLAALPHLPQPPAWGALAGVRPTKLTTRHLTEGGSPAQALRLMEKTYYVSPARSRLALDCSLSTVAAAQKLQSRDISLYVGIPFCPSRCSYCSFVSRTIGKRTELLEPYLEALLKELEVTGKLLESSGKTVRTVYIGGGTPTTLTEAQMARLLDGIRQRIDLSRCLEFTVEGGRPDTLTPQKLRSLYAHGADRLSINPQSMCDSVLRACGRPHNAQQVLSCYQDALDAGMSVCSLGPRILRCETAPLCALSALMYAADELA